MSKQLINSLRELSPTGEKGFEGLIARLLGKLTGKGFYLARSGNQIGRDMRSAGYNGNAIAVECKRYGKKTKLNERELIAELVQAGRDVPALDLWVLVASTNIPDQLFTNLQEISIEQGVEFRTISSEDSSPDFLESLCAHGGGITLDFFASLEQSFEMQKIQNELEQIKQKSNFTQIIEQLQYDFSAANVGYDHWGTQQNQWLTERFSSEQKSRSTFQQVLHVGAKQAHLIARTSINNKLDSWLSSWSESNKKFVLLGEEGDGKTWAISSWINSHIRNKDDFPPVIFLPSLRPHSTDPAELLAEAIAQQTGRFDVKYWKKRVTRWCQRPVGSMPIALLVLDGINERREPRWWRTLLEQLTDSPWHECVAVVITARNAYWKRYFSSLRHLTVNSFVSVLPPFDDDELDAALEQHGLSLTDIAPALFPLIRKPRYLDLVVKFRERMTESGDITVARLIYEDWRDRWSRKTNLSIDEDQFQGIIKGLARNVHQRNSQISEKDIADQMALIGDKQNVLDELASGGILHGIVGSYKVDERRLILGFSLLLVDLLKEEYENDLTLEEIIAHWLEPQEIDIKAQILESAVLDSLSQKANYPEPCQIALLQAWVESKNPQEDIADNFTAYFPLHPAPYFKLSEVLWSNVHDNPWGQELIMFALLHWKDSSKIQPLFSAWFEHWLGFINLEGFFFQRQKDKPEEQGKLKNAICDRAGEKLNPGPIEIAGYSLTVIDDDGLLRLGRVALAVMSHLSKAQFLRAITIGCLAEAIMGAADKYNYFAWVIRSSSQPLWDELKKQVEQLSDVNQLIAKQAAYRMLSFAGVTSAMEMQKDFSEDLFPINPAIEMHRKDPCTSFFAWSRNECETCLKRADILLSVIIQKIQRFCLDPEFSIPQQIGSRLTDLLQNQATEEIWLGRSQTIVDSHLRELEALICVYSPEKVALFYCSIFNNLEARRGLPLRQLCFKIQEYSLIFDDTVKVKLHTAWNRLIVHGNNIPEGEEYAEEFLFTEILIGYTAEQQLANLLKRPDAVTDLLVFEHSFCKISDWEFVRKYLNTDQNTSLQRVLWFLSAHPKEIPDEIMSKIVSYLTHPDSLLRSIILQILYQGEKHEFIDLFIQSDWYWQKDQTDCEKHWGSLVLAKFGKSLSFKELCRRTHPLQLGYAVICRGKIDKECIQYAECIHTIWQGCVTAPVLPTDFPSTEVDHNVFGSEVIFDRVSISSDTFSRGATFISRDAFWGGIGLNPGKSFADALKSVTDDQLEALTKIISDSIEDQAKAGNIWFSNSFSTHALDCVIKYRPDLLESWLAPLEDPDFHQFSHKTSFYEALCKVLFELNPSTGAELYCRLTKVAPSIKFIDSYTGLPVLRYALFSSSPTPEIVALWDKCLQLCKTDLDFLELVIVTQNKNGTRWLQTAIEKLKDSKIPFDLARAIILQGLMEEQRNDEWFLEMQTDKSITKTWHSKVAETAWCYRENNRWAKHWFQKFWQIEQDCQAWTSFRLLLKCADRRFWNWEREVRLAAGKSNYSNRRFVFFKNNISTLKNSIKRNEKNMGEHFLTTKVLDNQMWPWMQ